MPKSWGWPQAWVPRQALDISHSPAVTDVVMPLLPPLTSSPIATAATRNMMSESSSTQMKTIEGIMFVSTWAAQAASLCENKKETRFSWLRHCPFHSTYIYWAWVLGLQPRKRRAAEHRSSASLSPLCAHPHSTLWTVCRHRGWPQSRRSRARSWGRGGWSHDVPRGVTEQSFLG